MPVVFANYNKESQKKKGQKEKIYIYIFKTRKKKRDVNNDLKQFDDNKKKTLQNNTIFKIIMIIK